MARKRKTEFELDDFDFDKELDFGDFDFPVEPVKNDRNPVTESLSGFSEGFKEKLVSPEFIRNTVTEALPKGYGEALNIADSTASSLKELYDTAGKDLKPMMDDLRRTTGRILPKVDKILPKAVKERLDKFSKNLDEVQSKEQADFRELGLQRDLAEVFKTQITEDARREGEADTKEKIKQSIEQARHRDSVSQLDAIRISNQQLANYKTRIESNFQRKSLELQYRHYFVAVDMFQEAKRFNAIAQSNLQDIKKNTGLPDFVKMQSTEAMQEYMRNRFISSVGDTLFGGRQRLISKTIGKIGDVVKDRIRSFAGGAQMVLQGANMGLDTAEMMEQMGGVSGANLGGRVAGDLAAAKAGSTVAHWARGKVAKIPGVERLGSELGYGVENMGQRAKKYALSATNSRIPGLGFLTDIVKDAILGSTSYDTRIQGEEVKDMMSPAVFNNQSRKTLTEIIPGLLARQLRELQIIRTGDANIGLTSYDFINDRFSDTSSLKKSVLNSLVSNSEKSATQSDVNSLLRQLDPDGTKLTDEQRRQLGSKLVFDNLNYEMADPARLSKAETYAGMNDQDAKTYAKVFQEFYADDPDKIKKLNFSKQFNQLGTRVSDKRAAIQNLVNLGYGDTLRELKLLDGNNDLDVNQLYQYVLGQEYVEPKRTRAEPVNVRMNRNIRSADNVRATAMEQEQDASRTAPRSNNTGRLQHTELMAAVRDSSSRTATEEIVAILKGMDKRFEDGIRVFGEFGPGGGDGGGSGPSGGSGGPWWRRSVSDLGKSAYDTARGFAGRAREFGTDIFNKGRGLFDRAMPIGTGLFRKGMDAVSGWKDKLSQELPEWKLKAGHYRDAATGEIIKRYEDIKGAVLDENGKVVMTVERLKELRPGIIRGITRGVGKVVDFGRGIASDIGNRLPAVYQAGYRAIRTLADSAMDMLDGPQDVYVRGKEDPVLLARIMRAGGYFSKATGAVIKKISDIRGPIVDENGDVLLTTEDIQRGLLDKKGRVLRSGLDRALGIGKDLLMKGKNIIMGGASWLGDKASGLLNGFRNGFRNLVGPDGLVLSGGKQMRSLLEEIRDILLERLPEPKRNPFDTDSDGDRDGSAIDIIKRRAAEKEKRNQGKEGTAAGKAAGGFGVGGMFKSLTEYFKKRDEKEDEEDDSSLLEDAGNAADVFDALNGDGGGGNNKPGKKRGFFGRSKDKLASGAKNLYGRAKGAISSGAARAAPLAKAGLSKAGGAAMGIGSKIAAAGTAAGAGVAALGARTGMLGRAAGSIASGAGQATGWLGRQAGSAIGSGVRNAGSLIKSPLGFAAKGLGLAGAAYSAYSAYDNITQGNYGAAALDAGLGIGGLALTGGMGTVAATLAGGVGAILSAPAWLLGAAAIGAGYGLYKGYKYLTRNKLDKFSSIRYAQYGFSPSTPDYVSKVLGLEAALSDAIVWQGEMPVIDPKKVDMKEVLESFDIVTEDEQQVRTWVSWFEGRFKPVFFTHLVALNKVKKSVALSELDSDKLTAKEKLAYLKAARFSEGPYNVMTSPIPGVKLNATALDVQQAYDPVFKEMTTLAGKEAPVAKPVGDVAKATAAVVATATNPSPQRVASTVRESVTAPKTVRGYTSLTNAGTIAGAIGGTVVMTATGEFLETSNARIDALTAIRYKAYGLNEMEADKVRALARLEYEVRKSMTFDSNKQASWKGSPQQVLSSIGPAFGIEGISNSYAYDWLAWFNLRFIPTYLNFMTGLYKSTGKDDPTVTSIPPAAAIDVGTMLISSSTRANDSSTSVWTLTFSPWPGYKLNTDPRTTDGNMQGLKEAAKAKTLAEERANIKTTGQGGGAAAAAGRAVQHRAEQKTLWERVVGEAGDGISGGSGIVGAYQAVKSTVNKAKAAMGFGPAQEVNTGMTGTGGMYNTLPDAKGSGSWAAVKDLIIGASKMAGVDEKLMASMAAIESGFKIDARAPVGSASGLYQFINGTWKMMLDKYGKKYGIPPGTTQMDPKANALMGAEYIKDNIRVLKNVKPNLTDTDLYMAHFLGGPGAKKFFSMPDDAIPAATMVKEARNNQSIFFHDNGAPRTKAEIYNLLNGRVRNKAKQFNVNFGASAGSEAVKPTATPAPLTATAAQAVANTQANKPVTAVRKEATPVPKAPPPVVSATIPVIDQTPGKSMSIAAALPGAGTGYADSLRQNKDGKDQTPITAEARDRAMQPAPVQEVVPSVIRASGTQMSNRRPQEITVALEKGIADIGSTLLTTQGLTKQQLEVLQDILTEIRDGSKKGTPVKEAPKAPEVVKPTRRNQYLGDVPVPMTKQSSM